MDSQEDDHVAILVEDEIEFEFSVGLVHFVDWDEGAVHSSDRQQNIEEQRRRMSWNFILVLILYLYLRK